MFQPSFKKLRPGFPALRAVRDVQKAVTASAYHRPGYGMSAVSTPFGASSRLIARDEFYAISPGGVTAAVTDESNVTTFGVGTVNRKNVQIDAAGTVTLVPDTSYTITVYNLSQQPVASGVNLIVRFVNQVPVVVWEDCTTTTG